MTGLKRSSINILIALAFLIPLAHAQAHVPTPAQVIRHQPGLVKNLKPFRSEGTASFREHQIKTLLVWMRPGEYLLSLKNLPRSFFRGNFYSDQATLYRNGQSCQITAGSMKVACEASSFWALMELGGNVALIEKSLEDLGLYDRRDLVYQETDSRNPPLSPSDQKLRLGVGKNGEAPVAVAIMSATRTREDLEGKPYPVIHFDQSFWVPLLARFESNGDVYTLAAKSDTTVRRKRSRYTHVMATRLSVSSKKTLLATFERNEAESTVRKNPIEIDPSLNPYSVFSDALSLDGQNFFRALLLTH